MLGFNTNFMSLMTRRQLDNTTNILNLAVERMTTGFKVNHASDNAANYSIIQQMDTQISALDVAEDNASVGLDLLTTANDTLDLINERFIRLRNLAIQAENGTYGKESLDSINIECKALVDEIKRIYKEAEFNGLKIYGAEFFETVPTDGTTPIATYGVDDEPNPVPQMSTTFATESTTLQELGIDYSSFQIYNSTGGLIESYEVEKKDTIGDIFNVLNTYGISSSITDGVISISSTNGRYVDGDLMEAFGVGLDGDDFIAESTQNSQTVYCVVNENANEASTFAQLGALTSGTDTITVRDKYGDKVTDFVVDSNTTLGGLFNKLGNYDIQGSVDDGVITLSSSEGNYLVSQGVIANLGIGVIEGSSVVTTGTGQTSVDIVTYETITSTGGTVTTTQEEQTVTLWTTTTVSETVTNTVWTTETTSEVRTETVWTTTTTSSTVTETIWTTTTSSETQTNTVTITGTQSTIKTGTFYVEGTRSNSTYTNAQISAMTRVSSVSSFSSGQKYAIKTVDELRKVANWVNAGNDTTGVEFVLGADLDLSSVTNWIPIGNYSTNTTYQFKGTFDGNGHVIKNLTINNESISYQGLFGYVQSGEIKNVGLEDTSVKGANYVGALVGYANNSTISNCYTTGIVDGNERIGGLVGATNNSTISNCHVASTVTGDVRVGGLVGEQVATPITNCYATGNVTGTNGDIGGLVGVSLRSTISNSYATGTVTGGVNMIGGLVGQSNSTISNCYTTGGPTGHGLVGYSTTTAITNCASVQTDSYATKMTLAQIQAQYTPSSMGFTSANGWKISAGSPALSWQKALTTITRDTTLSKLGFSVGENVSLVWSNENGNGTITFTEVTSKTSIGNIIDQFNSGMGFYWGNLEGEDNLMSASLVNGVITFITPIGTTFDTTQGLFTKFGSLTTTNTVHTDQVVETNTIKTTTTTSTTNTETIQVTTTTETTNTITVDVTTTTSTTETETVLTTTTSSTTQTQMVDVVQTIGGSTTTTNVSMTADTSFALLGLDSRGYVTVMNDETRTIITIKTADTVSTLISKLDKAGVTATLANGKMTLSPDAKSIYISGMSSNLIDALNLESDFYSTSLGVEMTDSNFINYDANTTIKATTTLSEIGVTTGALLVQKDGANYATIAVSDSQTVGDLTQQLRNIGFNVKLANGAIDLTADGDMVLKNATSDSSNAISVFSLGNISQKVETTYANTDSSELFKLAQIVNSYWKSTSAICLQVGTTGDESSRIEICTGFDIHDLDRFANIGKKTVNNVDYIKELDNIINTISAKQTEIGAYENRLESVLEEISIRYENMVSSRSTLRDADLSEITSVYIQQQILQQASATLLSVANQSPQLALQLL